MVVALSPTRKLRTASDLAPSAKARDVGLASDAAGLQGYTRLGDI